MIWEERYKKPQIYQSLIKKGFILVGRGRGGDNLQIFNLTNKNTEYRGSKPAMECLNNAENFYYCS